MMWPLRFIILVELFVQQHFIKCSDLVLDYPGDLQIGALFPIHLQDSSGGCSATMSSEGIFQLEAFLFSLDKLNEDLRTSFGFTLGAVSLDTCGSERYALMKALKFVINDYLRKQYEEHDDKIVHYRNEKVALDVIGVVGPMKSSVTIQTANLFGLFKLPQISYGATSPTLSNQEMYPYFMRTVPSDINQAKALTNILKFINATYIVGVYANSNYGTRGFREFEALLETTNICFADKWKIDVEKPLTMNYLRSKLRHIYTSSYLARAIVLYVHQDLAVQIFEAARQEDLGHHFIWIGPDGWGNRHIHKSLNSVVEGAIVSLPAYQEVPGFRQYFYSLKPSTNKRNPWFGPFWHSMFNCSDKTLMGSAILNCDDERFQLNAAITGTEFGMLHFVRDAVYAFGEALKLMHMNICNGTRGVCEQFRAKLNSYDAQPLLDYLKNGSFKGVDDRLIRFTDGQDGPPVYTIANYQNKNGSGHSWVNIARIHYDSEDVRWSSSIENPLFKENVPQYPKSVCGMPCSEGFIRRYKQDKCCWTCEPCIFPQYQFNETHCNYCVTANSTSPPFYKPNQLGNGCSLITPIYVHFDNPFVSSVAGLSVLGVILVVGTGALFAHYSSTPIIRASGRELSMALLFGITVCFATVFVVVLKPSTYTCAFSRFLYSVGYTLCYAAIFIKTNRIARIFHHKNLHTSRKPRCTSPLSQLFIVFCLVGIQCMVNIIWLILKPSTPEYLVDLDYDERTVVVHYFCEAFRDEDMLVALAFPVCLLIFSAIYAFKTRKIPGRFNETKFIIITTYTTCIVWLAFIPLFFSTEKIPLRIYSLCAALVLNAMVTLICMFFPKLYVAICRPHKNTKEFVMGRKSILSMSSWRKDGENGYPSTTNDVEESEWFGGNRACSETTVNNNQEAGKSADISDSCHC